MNTNRLNCEEVKQIRKEENRSLLLDAKSQIGSQSQEIRPSQWLGQNVCGVICGGYSSRFYLPIRDQFPNIVVFDADMFHSRMPEVVLGENRRSVVITVDGCRASGEEVDLIQ
jgi:hypothetical protein